MRHSLSFVALWLTALPVLADPGLYDGVYKQTANAECALVGVEGGALKIADSIFYGVEVECLMSNPQEIDAMDATLYDMQCSNDGEVWSERAMLMRDAEHEGGIYMIWDGYAFRYDSCPAPDKQ